MSKKPAEAGLLLSGAPSGAGRNDLELDPTIERICHIVCPGADKVLARADAMAIVRLPRSGASSCKRILMYSARSRESQSLRLAGPVALVWPVTSKHERFSSAFWAMSRSHVV
jgi:hypothetical protein